MGRGNSAKYVLVQSEGFDDKRTALCLGQFCQDNGGIVKKNGSVSFQHLQSESLDFHRQHDLFNSTFAVVLIKQMPGI